MNRHARSGQSQSAFARIVHSRQAYHMRRVVDKLLPLGTARRRCCELGLTGIRVILTEGWSSFFWRATNRRRMSRLAAKTQNYDRTDLRILSGEFGPDRGHNDAMARRSNKVTNDGRDDKSAIVEDYQPLLGEFVWHSITVDEGIERISNEHFDNVMQVLKQNKLGSRLNGLKILEVACYAHTTGYMLSEKGADVTLFDISAHNLRLGKKIAEKAGRTTNVRRVAGDFHSLPFEDACFDFAYISSAVHHTLNWKKVVTEMMRCASPQGVIYFDNEPCRRDACFYGFRTNRMNAFTPFEKELHDLGMLRTFAEPYLGSRPETLFGMIENQRIPLYEFIAEIERHAEIVALHLTPEICMGDIEQRWIDMRNRDHGEICRVMKADLTHGVERAMAYYGRREEGLGFSLPVPADIDEFCRRISCRIAGFPAGEREQRIILSDLFGSAMSVVARKTGSTREMSSNGRVFQEQFVYHDDIYYSFPTHVSRFLIEESSLLPSIQKDDAKKIVELFPDDQWSLLVNDDGYKSLLMTDREAMIMLPAENGNLLLLIRFYLAESKGRCYRLALSSNSEPLYSYDVWQSDSVLFTGMVSLNSKQATRLLVSRSIPSEEDSVQETGNTGSVHILQAFAFRID